MLEGAIMKKKKKKSKAISETESDRLLENRMLKRNSGTKNVDR
jgi:hypothetical protein